jgi:hypothetical protein
MYHASQIPRCNQMHSWEKLANRGFASHIRVCVCVRVCNVASRSSFLSATVSVYLLCAEHAWLLLYNRPETTSLAKSDQIAQGMAQSAAWQSGHRESTQCLGDKPSYTYTQCAQGWLPVQAGGYSVWHVCWACVTDTCWVARLCMFLCAPLCVRVCAQRLELGIGWNFKTSYLARSRHELSVLVFGDVFLYLDKQCWNMMHVFFRCGL